MPAMQARRRWFYFRETFPQCSSHWIINHHPSIQSLDDKSPYSHCTINYHPSNLGHKSLKKRPMKCLFDLKDTILKKNCSLLASVPGFWPGDHLIACFHPCDEAAIFIPQIKGTLNSQRTQTLLLRTQKWPLWHKRKIKN